MQGIFSHPFTSLDADDLTDLVEVREVREHIHLDYKRDPYAHGHSGAVEMLADVTAMANAQGGYIIIGVEEDDTEPDGTPKKLVGIENGDTEAQWIQNVCLSSIDEKVVGLRVRDVSIPNERSCVIIQVPNSIRKPHMVVHKGHRSFNMRHGRSKSPMGMQEVRNMILSMNTYRASLERFLNERKEALKDLAGEKPRLLLMATPIYVDREKIDPLRQDIRDTLTKPPGLVDNDCFGIDLSIGFASHKVPQPRLFGIETTFPEFPDSPERILRLFRNGHLEYCEICEFFSPITIDVDASSIDSYKITVLLLHFLETANQVMQLAEVNEPVAVTLYLDNIASSYLNWWISTADVRRYGNKFIWLEENLNIEITANELSDRMSIACSIVDRLFNAFGYEKSPHFNSEGTFVKRR